MKEELIKLTTALRDKLKAIEAKNRAAWKARRKVDAAIEHLTDDWPKEGDKHEMPSEDAPKPTTPAA